MTFTNKWTKEQEKVLTELWNTELTCTQIAKKMGLSSKSMVIGKAHRLKLPKRVSPIKRENVKVKVETPPKEDKPLVQKVSLNNTEKKKRVRKPPQYKVAEKPVISAPSIEPRQEVNFVMRDIRGCRYPMWKDKERPTNIYCDKPISVKAYCAHHAAICYAKSIYESKKEAA